ncbi:MAG: thiol reductant ABC exporter subunit CydC [Anaerolineae bacterium]|nr:thiol reductant ABC exporter subunit CydC [Anaerolineae bacterium]
MALSVLLGFLAIGSSIGLLGASAWIIAMAALQPSIAVLQVAIVGVRFFGIARGIFRYLERLVSHQVTFRLLAELRVWFYSMIEPLAPAQLAGRRSGDLLSRIVSDIAALEQFYVRVVAPPLVALLTSALAVLIVGLHHPELIWPLLTFLMLTGLAAPLGVQLLARPVGAQVADSRAALSAVLVDGVQGAADLLAFGAAAMHLERIQQLDRRLAQGQARAAAITALNTAMGILFTWLASASVLTAAVPLVTAGTLSGVNLAVLTLVTLAAFEGVLPLPQAAHALQNSLAAARRLFELVARPGYGVPALPSMWSDRLPAATQPSPETTSAQQPPDLTTAPPIRVENLTMRYAPDEPPALMDVSFSVPAGSRIAVVGASGAGKSSLAAVMLRLWDYQQGQVWLDSHELRNMPSEWVRRQLTVVTQQTHLFNATVRENLLLARPEATQIELEQAARAAQIHDFICSLPAGYDTWIGEQGLQLSGGERQRLAIARAPRKNAPVLIPDEPTANLDADTAHALLQALQPFTAGKTTLLITHRLGQLRGDDQVLLFDRGRLIAAGHHADLLMRNPLYQRLWQREHETLGDR